MSFSWEQKRVIIERPYKSVCCRRALLCGVLFSKGTANGDKVTVSVERRETAEYISKHIKEFYGRESEIYRSDFGGRRFVIEFNSKSAAQYISNLKNNTDYFSRKCEACQGAFLKGIFLAAGRITDPKVQYSMEFSVGERTEALYEYLATLDLTAKISRKKSGDVVYFRDSAMMEYFYGLSGMNGAMFSLIDAKVEGEIRKNVGRIANCLTNNIKKTVDSAAKQVEIISALESANLLSSLPEELAATAMLRLEHQDLSLSQLAAIAVPAISKPGLSHRLKKIIELGEQLLKEKQI